MKHKVVYTFAITLVVSCMYLNSELHADSTSTNYTLVEDRFTGGTEDSSSTNYEAAEGSIGLFENADMTSTNYALETKTGVAGGFGIATINTITPADLAYIYTDDGASYVVSATTPDADTLNYRGKQGATIKDGPQTESTLTWTLSGSDVGRHTISLEVIDPDGTTLKTQEAYVVRRPTK